MQLPLAQVQSLLFARGAVLKMVVTFDQGQPSQRTKEKFVVVVGADGVHAQILTILSTSKVAKVRKLGRYGLFLAPSEVQFFPLETFLQCEVFHLLAKTTIESCYSAGKVSYIGRLPDDVLTKLDAMIQGSRHLSNRDKGLAK